MEVLESQHWYFNLLNQVTPAEIEGAGLSSLVHISISPSHECTYSTASCPLEL